MIKRVFENNDSMYYCTLCNRPFKALHEANEHAKFCGQAVPIQPAFKSVTTAATFDDDTQTYQRHWVGLTIEEVQDSCSEIASLNGFIKNNVQRGIVVILGTAREFAPHLVSPPHMNQKKPQRAVPAQDGYKSETKTWNGLTDEEQINIAYKSNDNEIKAVQLAEAKLKEKNT